MYDKLPENENVPQEPCAYDLLPGGCLGEAALRLAKANIRVWRWRLRSCRDCGADFQGPSWTTLRCPRCRRARARR